jgi:hypothetical protein
MFDFHGSSLQIPRLQPANFPAGNGLLLSVSFPTHVLFIQTKLSSRCMLVHWAYCSRAKAMLYSS